MKNIKCKLTTEKLLAQLSAVLKVVISDDLKSEYFFVSCEVY